VSPALVHLLDPACFPCVVGIVNVTPDSFHAGTRRADPTSALALARQLVAEGADALDIGGQSTRPGYTEVEPAEEIARVVPVLRALAAEFPGLPLSIDTYKAPVAAAALEAGATVLNDIHGLHGPDGPALAALAARHRAGLIVMHHAGLDPAWPSLNADVDPMPAMLAFLKNALARAAAAGVPASHVIVDPGLGFGKTQPQNVRVLRRLDELHALGRPVLLGVSRKSVLGHLVPELHDPADRLEATLAVTALAVAQGVQLHRVHEVGPARRAALTAHALRGGDTSQSPADQPISHLNGG
jgi:dihydropteroate synthase